ncbi:MAG: glycosyltransferase [Pseudomonadota bacterium]
MTIKISVVMAVYNGEEFVGSSIDSVLAQTFTDFEFIIVNDGSTDATLSILEDYAERDPRIRIIDQENTGVTLAAIKGCAAARGEYIARLDADDCCMPARFEKQVKLLDNNPALVAAIGDVEFFQDDGKVVNVAKVRGDPRLIRFYMPFCNHIGGNGHVMFRRDAYLRTGGYDASYRYSQDYDLWTRLLIEGDFGNVPETVYRYRTGHGNISNLKKDEQTHHALRTARREYERVTGEPQSEGTAMALLNFWWTRPPEGLVDKNYESASRAMRNVAKLFFKQHPDLRPEQFAIYRDIAARWFWWSKRVPPVSTTRAIFLKNFGVWGVKAVWARLRWGAK